ncbi:MAG: aspartyl protease family protein [Acidobacteriaceae bacterium]
MPLRRYAKIYFLALALLLALFSCILSAQQHGPAAELVAAEQLYRAGDFAAAADKYSALLKVDDKLTAAQVGLSRSLLRQQKVDAAYDLASKALAAQPNSAPLLAVMGDIDFRRAQMPDAERSYLAAITADPKEARAYLGLARLYRVVSLYRRAYDELVRAHQIAPGDPEVERAWFSQLPRKQRIAAIEEYLAKPHPDDAEQSSSLERYLAFLKATIDQPAHACRLTSKVDATAVRLEPLMIDAARLRGYGISVKFNDRNAKLLLDTGASGVVIGRKLAEKSGLTRISEMQFAGIGDKGPQTGYLAHAQHIKIGDLDFEDCVVVVSDKTSIGEEDGLLGADVFSRYLVDIDIPGRQLKLSPLPKRPDAPEAPAGLNSQGETPASAEGKAADAGAAKPDTAAPTLPRDRYIAPEMANWTRTFRFGHELLIPTLVNDSKPFLFLIDTGAFADTLSTNAAREVTRISSDSRLHVKGASGSVKDVYRADKATIQFGHMRQQNQDMVTFDLSNLSRHTGTEVSGILGFAMLRMLEIKIDYRDGLVDFAYDPKRIPLNLR